MLKQTWIKDIISHIAGGENLESFKQFMSWPPDAFAVTSLILIRSGSYRYALSDTFTEYQNNGSDQHIKSNHARVWQSHIERQAKLWVESVNTQIETGNSKTYFGSVELENCITVLETLATKVTFEHLKTLSTDDSRKLSEVLIEIHCCADEACAGMGLPSIREESTALVHCLANLLLTATGSLATISKSIGIVLPKMRTPQSGLTLRSLSHHLSFQETEVEVVWRTIPWANMEENTLNILAIPIPEIIESSYFSTERDSFESVRYFNYSKPSDVLIDKGFEHAAQLVVGEIVSYIKRANNDVGRIHAVVMPEAALTRLEQKYLLRELTELHKQGLLKHVPMMIIGLRDNGQNETEEAIKGHINEVRLSAYLAGRWYELSQRKHHRWKLTREQIQQYGLDGRLSTTRDWFENISITQRRLSFLAPTG